MQNSRKRDAMEHDCHGADHEHPSSLPPATLRDAVCCTEALAVAEVNVEHRYKTTPGRGLDEQVAIPAPSSFALHNGSESPV